MSRGDVVWVTFPSGRGHAQSGRRPAIVFQNDDASAVLPTVLMVPLTSQLDALRFPGTVAIDGTPDNGLKKTSVAMLFQLTVVDARDLGPTLGSLNADELRALDSALLEITSGI